jgi:hypothetical protein
MMHSMEDIIEEEEGLFIHYDDGWDEYFQEEDIYIRVLLPFTIVCEIECCRLTFKIHSI